jgi:hypothetical protein
MKKEIDKGKASGTHPAFPYINGMEHEIAMLSLDRFPGKFSHHCL